jgi:hypothetical protein
MKRQNGADDMRELKDRTVSGPRPETIDRMECGTGQKSGTSWGEEVVERESIDESKNDANALAAGSDEDAIRGMALDSADEMIERRFGSMIPPERKAASISAATRFETHSDFREKILERDPRIDKSALEQTIAYWDGNEIVVDADTDRQRQLHTIIHEKLHSASDPGFEKALGGRFDEGTTEYFAKDLTKGSTELKDIGLNYNAETKKPDGISVHSPRYYEDEKAIVNIIVAQAGEDALAKAYFRGDMRSLREGLGGGEFLDQIAGKLRSGNISGAKDLMVRRFGS